MTLGALVDAGADRAYIEDELSKIKLEPYSLDWKRVIKRGISATKLDVVLDPEHPPKHHRHYSEIVKVIREAKFSDRATALSLAIFEKIAIAEAKIHGTSIEKVHFHEVGAIDSIVDIVGVALAIDSLHIERIYASPVPLGSGTIHIDHGIYPVPAPATLEMMVGVPIASTPYAMEMTTPTGAGIIAGIVVGQIDPYIGKWQLTHEHLAHDHHHEHAHEDHHHYHGHDHHHHHEHTHDHDHDHDHTHHHDHDHDHHDHKHEHDHSH
ncbi:LarC family nickel insertion protein [Paenibacillus alginolyticus]|nr:LarC family nickel insertion protein [Paenibacillus alginolyticus]